jgi:thioredoxin-related protein
MRQILYKSLLSLLAGYIFVVPVFSAELVMFEQAACPWCERWEQEVGVVYNKTIEGKFAPLRRVDIHQETPDDLKDVNPGRFTPTFVLLEAGQEIGRIRGYPGESFFWELFGQMLKRVSKKPTKDG